VGKKQYSQGWFQDFWSEQLRSIKNTEIDERWEIKLSIGALLNLRSLLDKVAI